MSVKPLPVHGVDISHHQAGSLDLAGAKRRGLRWLYHKATEGESFRDANYGRRREECRRAGIPFGAYHFARADVGDARQEAKFFLDYAQPKPGDLRPALDLETMEGLSIAQIRTWAATFIAYCVKRTGVKPVVYTPFDLGSVDDGCIIWRPRYNNTNTPPVLPWDIWQFSNGVYGVPNQVSGIGRVDLNVMDDGLRLAEMLIPEPKEERPSTRLHLMHASLQFSDSDRQQTADITKIFDRAADRKVAWITGTEAGDGAAHQQDELLRIGREHGYRMWVPGDRRRGSGSSTDCWIAVRLDLIHGGWRSWERGYIPVLGGSKEYEDVMDLKGKRWGPKGIVNLAFDTEDLGRIHVAAAHYLTDSRRESSPYFALNKILGTAVGEWAIAAGKGSDLAFYGGDQNMADSRNKEAQGDTFFGQPLTSAWDELEKWENTGHGNIDVIASYDRDGRVSARYVRALDDREFPLNTDHFLVEAGYDVRHLR